MKNVYEVLRQKELELARLEKEVEALRVAAPLLSDEKESVADASKPALTGPRGAPTAPAPPPGWGSGARSRHESRRRMGRRGQALAVSSRTIRKAKAQEKILGFLLYGPITASISGRQSAVSSGTPS